MSDEMDPEIAALIGGDLGGSSKPGPATARPDFSALFGESGAVDADGAPSAPSVDLGRKTFAPIEKFEEPNPKPFLADPDWYKKVLTGEAEESQKVHAVLTKYLQAQDPKDRGVYRQQLITSYWALLARLAAKCASAGFPFEKLALLRYGVMLPTLLSQDQRDIVQRVPWKSDIDEPVYYVDEWLKAVALGRMSVSATDEVKHSDERDDRSRFAALLQKAEGKRDTAEGLMKARADERRSLELLFKERADSLSQHPSVAGMLHVPAPYTEAQKKTMGEFLELLRRMQASDKELGKNVADYRQACEDVDAIREKMGGISAESKADYKALAQEFETLRQMAKMCVGRQGNHFPILTKEYFHGGFRDVGTRENVLQLMAWVESIDTMAYARAYKTTFNRIVPYVLLIPSYGDSGFCWEPFDRFNRATSRGRIAVPMYPKSLQLAVITAVADLRWQVAKEKASYYWMEEGLTGNYYQWFSAAKLKGDVKEYFIQDYILWLTKEAEGTQKLDKEVRAIFWRYMPYPQELKDRLKTRSYVYQELCQKDLNRSLSDGY